MSRLLYIKASPRADRSRSVAVAEAFVKAWKDANPGAEVAVKDVFTANLPAMDGLTLQAKYAIMHGQEHGEGEKRAWTAVESQIREFASFDRYVFAVPMWNFSIPYRLKHYLDVLIQPGYTFKVDENGYQGLLTGKKALLALASGGEYGPGCPTDTWDYQTGYLRMILGFMGITDVALAEARGTLSPAGEGNLAKAVEQARQLAASF
ncbi:FMN-dependent NADH-azoreductase [Desulfocurvus sp. DL9XJH121]